MVWLTGFPAAGKTTLATGLAAVLEDRGMVVEVLDGDECRQRFGGDLGYSREDRDMNVARVAWVASRLCRVGVVVIVAMVSPYANARRLARELIEDQGTFLEVHVATVLDECMRRDPKGLYARAAGDGGSVTGVSDPYEAPEDADVRIDTTGSPIEESVQELVRAVQVKLRSRSFHS